MRSYCEDYTTICCGFIKEDEKTFYKNGKKGENVKGE
jgi:hypothetical protein